MKSYISLILLLLLFCSTRVQKGLTDYLSAHRYPFTLEKGFDPAMADTLERRLAGYRMILQAEGGSHYLTFYNGLQLCWLQFLQKHLGLRHFVGESGHASAVLLNQYLQTGDSAYIIARGKPFWRDLYSYNATLSDKEKIHYIGLDFDWSRPYYLALKLILPRTAAPEVIRPEIEMIRNVNDSNRDCDYQMSFNKTLKSSLLANVPAYRAYFGSRYFLPFCEGTLLYSICQKTMTS